MNNQTGNVILGTLIGAAVGLAAGILLAPAKGSDTRQQLSDKTDELKNSLNDVAGKAMDSLKDLREAAERTMKKKADDFSAKVKNAVNEKEPA